MRLLKFLFPALLLLCSASHAQTVLSGGIYNNVTFFKNQSPYIITPDVIIMPGVTVFVEPGAVVKFRKGARLIVRGNLRAIGNVTDSVIFTADTTHPSMGYYSGIVIEVNGSVPFGQSTNQLEMQYCIGEYANEFVKFKSAYNGPYTFRNCRFAFNRYVNYDIAQSANAVYWDKCLFHNNYSGMSGGGEDHKVYITNCWFVDNTYGSNGGHVNNCVYKGNTGYGASLYQEIENSYFFENKVGASLDMHHDTRFYNNEVFNNDIGIEIQRMWQVSHIVLINNRICYNTTYNVQYNHTNNIDLGGNCWCSNDSNFISSKIRDGYDNPIYGLIDFESHHNCGIKLPPPAEIKDVVDVSSSFTIYPNPAQGFAVIEPGKGIHTYDLTVRGVNGNVVISMDGQMGKSRINTSVLAPGMYIVQISHDGSVLPMQKLIVQ